MIEYVLKTAWGMIVLIGIALEIFICYIVVDNMMTLYSVNLNLFLGIIFGVPIFIFVSYLTGKYIFK